MSRFVPVLLLVAGLAGCGTSSDTVTVGGATVAADTAGAGLSSPLGGIGGGVGVATVTPVVPPPTALRVVDPAVQRLYGPWTLARAGDRVCTVDLGSPNAAGVFVAKTRNCMSVELARIARWERVPEGILLYDFEQRPVVRFAARGPDLFEGALFDGTVVTLWR